MVQSANIMRALLSPVWLFAVIVIGPLLALLSVNFALMISSRVTDPRAAEQISVVIIVPVLLIFFAQIAGLFYINASFVIGTAIVLLITDLIMLYFAERVFQRETILTRWK
jgi:ABC-2 type transport system permease protein